MINDLTLYDLAKGYVAAVENYEHNTSDPHGADEIEYAEELLAKWFTNEN